MSQNISNPITRIFSNLSVIFLLHTVHRAARADTPSKITHEAQAQEQVSGGVFVQQWTATLGGILLY